MYTVHDHKFVCCAIVLIASVVGGCATHAPKPAASVDPHREGKVSGALIDAPAADQYAASPNVRYEPPAASPENALPVYPPDLLSRRLPAIEVKIRLIVDERGVVIQAQPLETMPDGLQPFLAAVQTAVSHWQFVPLVQIIDGPGQTTVSAGDVEMMFDGQAKALPFHQDYAFTFDQVNGKPIVNAAPR